MAASATCIFPSPGEFDMAKWTLYKFRLERYLRSPAVKNLSNQSKIDLMLATMGKTADSIYLMFRDKFSTTSTVEDALEEFDTYRRDLWMLAEPCEIPDKEDRIRDQLILGLSNTEFSMTHPSGDPKCHPNSQNIILRRGC
jgi:hypothetical protein